jgi:hypothetical protein
VPLTDSWDWKVNITEIAIAKTANPSTGTKPPSNLGGGAFAGPTGSDIFYTFGGTYFSQNSSFGNAYPDPATYSVWSYQRSGNTWGQYDVSAQSTNRPSHGSYTDAPDQGLGFYLGGQLDSSSEVTTQGFGNGTVGLEGLIVLNMTDTKTPRVRNVSAPISLGNGIVSGSITYVPTLSDFGVLVAMGGSAKSSSTLSVSNGSLLTFDEVDILDIGSLYGNGNPAWYKQKTSGVLPQPRTNFCTVEATAPDNSSHNM